MARFRVEVSTTTRMLYEVEAEHRSDIHDQFDDAGDNASLTGWFLAGESYG